MSGPKNALAAWSASALRYVELPTGMKALVRLPDVVDLIRRDALPSDLRDLAMKYAKGGIEIATLDPEELKRFVAFTYELSARMIRYLAPPDSNAKEPGDPDWEPVSLTGPELAEMDVDQSDLEALAQISGRMKTTNEITAMSRFDRGLLSESERNEASEASAGSRVSDFASFRGQPAGAPDGSDGGDVLDPAVVAPAGRRPGHRVRGRRGASP